MTLKGDPVLDSVRQYRFLETVSTVLCVLLFLQTSCGMYIHSLKSIIYTCPSKIFGYRFLSPLFL